MKTNCFYIAFILFIFSCKKVESGRDESVIFGGWNWLYTTEVNKCFGSFTDMDSTSEGTDFKLFFNANNEFRIYEKTNLVSIHIVKFNYFDFPNGKGIVPSNDKIEFEMILDNDETQKYTGRGTLKSVKINNLVHDDLDNCTEFLEYFRKEF